MCSAHSLADNKLCGVNRLNGGTYTAEGITALCEVLKDTQITSLKCAALAPLPDPTAVKALSDEW